MKGIQVETELDASQIKDVSAFIFTRVRHPTARKMPEIHREGYSREDLMDMVLSACERLNRQFNPPLSNAEIRGIAKSITNWCFDNLTREGFSEKQRARAMRRWAGHTKSEPWKQYGVSRTTYYRRKKDGTLTSL